MWAWRVCLNAGSQGKRENYVGHQMLVRGRLVPTLASTQNGDPLDYPSSKPLFASLGGPPFLVETAAVRKWIPTPGIRDRLAICHLVQRRLRSGYPPVRPLGQVRCESDVNSIYFLCEAAQSAGRDRDRERESLLYDVAGDLPRKAAQSGKCALWFRSTILGPRLDWFVRAALSRRLTLQA